MYQAPCLGVLVRFCTDTFTRLPVFGGWLAYLAKEQPVRLPKKGLASLSGGLYLTSGIVYSSPARQVSWFKPLVDAPAILLSKLFGQPTWFKIFQPSPRLSPHSVARQRPPAPRQRPLEWPASVPPQPVRILPTVHALRNAPY